MIDTQVLRSSFLSRYGAMPSACFAAPGRINLIGEHTDYNGGFVFPGAIEQCIACAISPNGTQMVRAYSIDLDDYCEFDINDQQGPKHTHFRYLYGVVRELMLLGVAVKGFDTTFAGDVPLGAGMSSSAALESCFAFALNKMYGTDTLSKMELAKVGQRTEHNYIGVKCGIMDQFASMHGRKGELMRLDCRSGEFEYFPWHPEGYRLVLINSCVKHELVGSPYNDRRMSCERVVAAINRLHPELKAETLRDVDWSHLKEVQSEVSEEDMRRATFVLGEKDRVLAVCDALQKGDYERVGEMMYLTHQGLSADYEVSCEELDFLNDIARQYGVTGSRIMGGGFGGCTINLVRNDLYDTFVATAVERFAERYAKQPIVIPVVIGDGARQLE
ncbi:MAG: galactokinase [Bacteroidales bacterium]|nr:galactokinase [Bacteroidales bacterium]